MVALWLVKCQEGVVRGLWVEMSLSIQSILGDGKVPSHSVVGRDELVEHM